MNKIKQFIKQTFDVLTGRIYREQRIIERRLFVNRVRRVRSNCKQTIDCNVCNVTNDCNVISKFYDQRNK
jgi:hypothetical protein